MVMNKNKTIVKMECIILSENRQLGRINYQEEGSTWKGS